MSIQVRLRATTSTSQTIGKIHKGLPLLMKSLTKDLDRYGNRIVRTSKSEFLSRSTATTLGVRSGRLRSSMISQPVSGKLAQEVGTNVFYGRIHELIGVGRRKTKRPFIEPSIKKNEAAFIRDVDASVRRIYG